MTEEIFTLLLKYYEGEDLKKEFEDQFKGGNPDNWTFEKYRIYKIIEKCMKLSYSKLKDDVKEIGVIFEKWGKLLDDPVRKMSRYQAEVKDALFKEWLEKKD